MSHSTHYKPSWRHFYSSYEPINSVKTLKEAGQSSISPGSPHRVTVMHACAYNKKLYIFPDTIFRQSLQI